MISISGLFCFIGIALFGEAAGQMKEIYRYAGWYDLRLRVSRKKFACTYP